MIQNKKDFKLGVGLSAFCLFLLLYLIPSQVGSLTEPSALMPTLITGFILLLSLLLAAQSVRRPGQKEQESVPKSGERPASRLTLAAVVAIIAAYAWLLEITGFVLTSLAVMVVLFLVFGVHRWLTIGAITLVTLGALYVSFEILLGAPLPVGRLIENFLE